MSPVEYIMLANAILQGVNRILEFGHKARLAAQARGEWTEEQEREFDEHLASLKGPNAPAHWVPQSK